MPKIGPKVPRGGGGVRCVARGGGQDHFYGSAQTKAVQLYDKISKIKF